MALLLATPISPGYTGPITLFIAGAAFLMHAAWCSYMGETDEFYPTDSRVLPNVGRGGEPPDIGFNNKYLICVIAGGFLIACATVLFLAVRHHSHATAAI